MDAGKTEVDGPQPRAAELTQQDMLLPGVQAAYDRNHQEGAKLFKEGKPGEALQAYDRAILLVGEQGERHAAWAIADKGDALLQLGRTKEAVAALERATELLPEEDQEWVLDSLGTGYERLAKEAFKKVQKINPANKQAEEGLIKLADVELPAEQTIPAAEVTQKVEIQEVKSVVSRFGEAETVGNVRTSMEDEMIIVPNFGGRADQLFAGIYDGHGGSAVAELVKEQLHMAVLRGLGIGLTPDEATKRAYLLTDKATDKFHNQGATAVTALFVGQELWVANVGDARAVLDRGGVADRLSRDHNLSDPQERARLQRDGGEILQDPWGKDRVGGLLMVPRAIGDHDAGPAVTAEPDIRQVTLQPNDRKLIMACDGLWDVFDDQDAINFIKDVDDPDEASKLLMEEALRRGSTDNISIQVLNLNVN